MTDASPPVGIGTIFGLAFPLPGLKDPLFISIIVLNEDYVQDPENAISAFVEYPERSGWARTNSLDWGILRTYGFRFNGTDGQDDLYALLEGVSNEEWREEYLPALERADGPFARKTLFLDPDDIMEELNE